MRAVPHNPERSTAVPKHRNRVIGSHRIPLTNPLDGSKTSKILVFFLSVKMVSLLMVENFDSIFFFR